ncbi:uncharacterized protein DSM5745_03079 [Aspergillus mulundensis]|uniref:Nucleoside phosphorylase domain-containing protein n=1 Tax=Aspergillus mulundensis TaxID=1810919 RepID=A0A3D8SJD7_9EURO|nr:Uncharacterized protein DSM5745_03079 [Aspergillus mulundensis]RDW86437.1 Uncharacterized protein DSM5745_03079 [Aspergillus mulundensis]
MLDRTHEDYTVGWICPLEIEQIPAVRILDEIHPCLGQSSTDYNTYILGSIAGYDIVIAGLHLQGNNPAASVVMQMRNTFPNIRSLLLVGIGGGVTVETDGGRIRLGDVVISKPTGENPGVVKYDRGQAEAGRFFRTGALPPPPTVLLNAVGDLAQGRFRANNGDSDPVLRRFQFPGRVSDNLYPSDYIHRQAGVSCSWARCDPTKCIEYDEAKDDRVRVHRGVIASGELVVEDAIARNHLAAQCGVLCFEREAAGALADIPCLVIRGISDYCDSHKNDVWHGYAAATAAAYARELFLQMPIYDSKNQLFDIDTKEGIRLLQQIFASALRP